MFLFMHLLLPPVPPHLTTILDWRTQNLENLELLVVLRVNPQSQILVTPF